MTNIPTGLVDGKAPLLTEFLHRRQTMIVRIHQVRAQLSSVVYPQAALVNEFNTLADTLSGRRRA